MGQSIRSRSHYGRSCRYYWTSQSHPVPHCRSLAMTSRSWIGLLGMLAVLSPIGCERADAFAVTNGSSGTTGTSGGSTTTSGSAVSGSSGGGATGGSNASTPTTQQSTCPSPALPSGDTSETLQVGSVSRSYVLHVPTTYDGRKPVPLIVDFHGIGGS